MKKIIKLTAIMTTLTATIFSLTACNGKKEATIVSEEVTEETKEHETVEASTAEKFSYTDLVMDNIKLFMTEDEVKSILGEPVTIIDSSEMAEKTNKSEDTTSSDKSSSSGSSNSSNNSNSGSSNNVSGSGSSSSSASSSSSSSSTDSNSDAATDEYYEKVYSYNELTLIFMKLDDENHAVENLSEEGNYKLTAIASLSEENTFSRGLKVGDKLENILDKYYRDQDYKNNYYTLDGDTVLGNYLYGDSTIDTLESDSIEGILEYGIIDYTGYTSLETAEEYMVTFTCFGDTYKSEYADIEDDFAQLTFDMNNDGEITAIRWYYYPEE